jgi:hypothetical protein
MYSKWHNGMGMSMADLIAGATFKSTEIQIYL